MEISPKALYNSLRMSFLQNPHVSVERWKVEDYRQISTEELFSRLQEYDLSLDRQSFVAFADLHDSPEELFDDLVATSELENEHADQLYLVTFELWRRLCGEKQSISIISDELDYQMFLYDEGKLSNREPLEDALSSFLAALEDNVDHGMERLDVFLAISEYLANDAQAFLIDYISDLIEQHEYVYAGELLEQFYAFMPDKKWFDLLHARLIGAKDIRKGHELLSKLLHHTADSCDLLFTFDMLAFLTSLPEIDLFYKVAHRALRQVEKEEDFQELLQFTIDFFKTCDMHEKAQITDELLHRHASYDPERLLAKDDPDLALFEKLLQ